MKKRVLKILAKIDKFAQELNLGQEIIYRGLSGKSISKLNNDKDN